MPQTFPGEQTSSKLEVCSTELCYWKFTLFPLNERYSNAPKSKPDALNFTGGLVNPMAINPLNEPNPPVRVCGSAESTHEGTVKVPGFPCAKHSKAAPLLSVIALNPIIITVESLLPPVQVTVKLFDRFTFTMEPSLVQVSAVGTVSCPLNAPTSAPPEPLSIL